jgi:hypothetical protein
MKPISNIVYWIQYLTISLISDLPENIYEQIMKTDCMLAGFAGRHVVCFGDLSIDVFLEIQNIIYIYIYIYVYIVKYCIWFHLWYEI